MSSFFRGLVIICLASAPAALRASCGAASCPLDASAREDRGRGWGRVGYQFEYVVQDHPRIGREPANVGEIPGRHDEQYSVSRVHRLAASYGFTDRWSADALLPFVSRRHGHIHNDESTGESEPETWEMSGLGDLALLGRYAFVKTGGFSLSAAFGVKLPTGASHEKNGAGEEAEPGVQPGSGSTDWTGGLTFTRTFPARTWGGLYGQAPLFLSAYYKVNGRGHEGYRLGDALQANLGAAYPVLERFNLLAQLNVKAAGRDGAGETHEEVSKTGGEHVYFSPGLEWRAMEDLSLSAVVQFPVYQRVNQIQLTSDKNVFFEAVYRFQRGF